ncbi:hypothetical protein ZIOFF_048944 [Zingiber officinale]|uniref:Uncharacterized protein n=1 Tax=Zingiber officinale TaxID=94328 RepID=A0A8J5KX49_ZINOF|nr:hypothetical protein ZIOFF_048944 [Zingiber officinale]
MLGATAGDAGSSEAGSKVVGPIIGAADEVVGVRGGGDASLTNVSAVRERGRLSASVLFAVSAWRGGDDKGESETCVSKEKRRRRFVNWMKEFTKGKELVRPNVTHFAISYLTIRRLLELKGELIVFFFFFWHMKNGGSSHSKKKKGQEICNIIFDTQNFWPNVKLCLKIVSPLIKVLRMVDFDDKHAMGFLYKAIEHVKEEIKTNLRSSKKRYEPVYTIIDKRWKNMLSQSLHATGYYWNPQYHYSQTFLIDVNVKHGLYECMTIIVPNVTDRDTIDQQLDRFRMTKGLFGIENAIQSRNTKSPESRVESVDALEAWHALVL